jgi:formamidopyrimidine-DNA glycosylase
VPALPEVEVIRRDLEKEIVGRRIKDVDVRPGSNAMKVFPRHGRRKEIQELLEGAKVEKVERIGMRIGLELDNGHTVLIDLGPAGQLHKTSASDDVLSHTHLILGFTIGGQLRYVDPMKQGEIFIAPTAELDGMEGLRGFLIDPLEGQIAWQRFSEILVSRDTAMKSLLMDDRFIVGLGEIYSDEILFLAGLRYDRPSNKLTSQDVRRLYRALTETMQEAVKARGVAPDSESDEEYTDLHGESGSFAGELKVYQREGEFCRRCRNTVIKEEFEGIETYYCPQCQS